jgi:hypothetical protein
MAASLLQSALHIPQTKRPLSACFPTVRKAGFVMRAVNWQYRLQDNRMCREESTASSRHSAGLVTAAWNVIANSKSSMIRLKLVQMSGNPDLNVENQKILFTIKYIL